MTRFIVSLLLAVACFWAHAVEPLIVRELNVEDGLSQSTVYDVFQDSRGFVWLATENGLNRYDGHQFSQFLPGEADNTIPSGFITSISEDIFKKIWVATFEGVAIYDQTLNTFTVMGDNSKTQNGLMSSQVIQLLRHSNGSMWLATLGGLHHYVYEDRSFTVHTIPDSVRPQANEIMVLAEAPDGKLVVGTQKKGVLLFDPQTGSFESLYYLEDEPQNVKNEIRALYFDSRNKLWIGTNQGLLVYDYYRGELELNVLEDIQLPDIQRQRVRSITQDEDGKIWVAVYGDGILSLDPRSMEYTMYGYLPSIRHGLRSDAVRKLFFDDSGLLWIGTEGYGVNIWNPVSSAFGHLTHLSNDDNSLSDNVVWSIETDHQQNLWVGTDRGLNRVSPDLKTITRYMADANTGLSSDLVYALEADELTGHLWIATDRGLNRLEPGTGQVQTFRHDDLNQNSLVDDLVYDLELDHNRQLWLATNSGLDRLDLNTMQFHHYRYSPDDPHSLTKNTSVSKLFIDSNGSLWVGTDNGINRYNPEQDNFDRFLYTEGASYNSETTFISAIAEVKRNVLWVGYGGSGIATMDFSQDSPNGLSPKTGQIGIENGLPTNLIFGIIPDHFGRAWISTMNGLMLYDMNDLNHRVFGAKEGLLGSEFNDGAYNVAADGSLYFGTTNGVAIIYPGEIKTPANTDKLNFIDATLYREAHSQVVSLQGKTQLAVDHHTFAIKVRFSALNYYASHQTSYAYQLSSDKWIELGDDFAITLNNLAIGQHTLKVRSKIGGAEWSQPQTLDIHIQPPAWRTWWAHTLYILLLLVSIGWGIGKRRRRVAEKLKMNNQLRLFAEAFKNTTEGVMIMHSSRTIVAVNAAFTAITGYAEDEVIGSGTDIINSRRHSEDFYDHIWQTLDEERQWHGEIWQNNKKGEDIAVEMTVSSVTNEASQISHFVAVFSDITERLNAEQELRKLAKYDSLTGLPNRTLLQDRLEHAISHSRREHQKLAVLFLDLDRFKQVNDSLGHDIGDLLLINVSERISKILREDDTFARLGGDEFVIIVEDMREINELAHVASRIISALQKPFSLVDYDVSTSTSIGITIYPDDGDTSQALLKNADTAMYHAKSEGRNNFQFYTQSMNVQAFERLSIESELRRAIEKEEFVLYYQPRVDSEDGTVPSMEALIRWRHPEKGILSPGYFIDIAEDCGLIVPISEWVIKQACAQLRSWDKSGFNQVSISVNLSPRLFGHYDLVSFIEQNLMFYQVSAKRLELEITEGILMDDVEQTIKILQKLNALGCHISVDDFGTGYSSLSYLHRFPVHTLKIDRSFVNAIDQHEQVARRWSTLLSTSRKTWGWNWWPKGVEDKDQFANFCKDRTPGACKFKAFTFQQTH